MEFFCDFVFERDPFFSISFPLVDIVTGLSKLHSEKDETVRDKLKQEMVSTTLLAQLDVLESHLKANGQGEYFVPSGMTFADFSPALLLFNLELRSGQTRPTTSVEGSGGSRS